MKPQLWRTLIVLAIVLLFSFVASQTMFREGFDDATTPAVTSAVPVTSNSTTSATLTTSTSPVTSPTDTGAVVSSVITPTALAVTTPVVSSTAPSVTTPVAISVASPSIVTPTATVPTVLASPVIVASPSVITPSDASAAAVSGVMNPSVTLPSVPAVVLTAPQITAAGTPSVTLDASGMAASNQTFTDPAAHQQRFGQTQRKHHSTPVAASTTPIQTSVTQPSTTDLPNSLFPSSLPTQSLMPTQSQAVRDATTASLAQFKGLYASDFASYAPLFSELEQAQIRLSDDAARFRMLSDRIQAVAHRSSYPMPLTEPAGSSF